MTPGLRSSSSQGTVARSEDPPNRGAPVPRCSPPERTVALLPDVRAAIGRTSISLLACSPTGMTSRTGHHRVRAARPRRLHTPADRRLPAVGTRLTSPSATRQGGRPALDGSGQPRSVDREHRCPGVATIRGATRSRVAPDNDPCRYPPPRGSHVRQQQLPGACPNAPRRDRPRRRWGHHRRPHRRR